MNDDVSGTVRTAGTGFYLHPYQVLMLQKYSRLNIVYRLRQLLYWASPSSWSQGSTRFMWLQRTDASSQSRPTALSNYLQETSEIRTLHCVKQICSCSSVNLQPWTWDSLVERKKKSLLDFGGVRFTLWTVLYLLSTVTCRLLILSSCQTGKTAESNSA